MAVYTFVFGVQGTVECVIQIHLRDMDGFERRGMFGCIWLGGLETLLGFVEIASGFSTLLDYMSMKGFPERLISRKRTKESHHVISSN